MSTLIADRIENMLGHPLLEDYGSVVQTVTVRSDTRQAISMVAPIGSGTGSPLTNLAMTITPRNSDSLLVMTWHIFFEADENTGFRVLRNNAFVTTSPYESWGNPNASGGVTGTWNCLTCAPYDAANNNDTTPHEQKLVYYDAPGSGTFTYQPTVHPTNTTATNFYLNRNFENTGNTSGREVGVSFGRIFEIAGGTQYTDQGNPTDWSADTPLP